MQLMDTYFSSFNSKQAIIRRDILSVLSTYSEYNSRQSSELHLSIYLKHSQRLLVSFIENWKMHLYGQASVYYTTIYKVLHDTFGAP